MGHMSWYITFIGLKMIIQARVQLAKPVGYQENMGMGCCGELPTMDIAKVTPVPCAYSMGRIFYGKRSTKMSIFGF